MGAGTAMPSVPLAKLVHDSVQAAYKELHALLDSLSDKVGFCSAGGGGGLFLFVV